MCVCVCVFQTEAMHPDCALVVQHMKALEDCNQILKQEEESNRSTGAGQSAVSLSPGRRRPVMVC